MLRMRHSWKQVAGVIDDDLGQEWLQQDHTPPYAGHLGVAAAIMLKETGH